MKKCFSATVADVQNGHGYIGTGINRHVLTAGSFRQAFREAAQLVSGSGDKGAQDQKHHHTG